MKYKKVIKLLIIGLLLFGFLKMNKWQAADSFKSFKTDEFEDKITTEDMKKDLDFIVKVLAEVHPNTYKGFTEEQRNIIEKAYDKIKSPINTEEFYFIANEIISSMKDGHTAMHLQNSFNDKGINLRILWLNDGMYVGEDTELFQRGDRIISIGNKDEVTILNELSKIIPAENTYWTKYQGAILLTKELFLKHLGLATDDEVELVIDRDGIKSIINVAIEKLKVEKSKEDWVFYKIDKENSLGILTLNKCIYNQKYMETVGLFFQDVAQYSISNIVVDVRENLGGDSRVIDEFIRYINIDEYKSYGTEIRFSHYAKQQRGYNQLHGTNFYPHSIVTNNKLNNSKLAFNGELYILTSAATFSSGNMFPVIIKDNNLGKVIGEPTGNKPSSYGDILSLSTPINNLKFIVSHKRFYRPDITKHEEDSVYPDITVYTTIEDVMENKDSQMDALIQIINN